MSRKLYQEIASCVVARLNCIKANNVEWLHKHEDRIRFLVADKLPSGSGVDNGTTIDLDRSNAQRLYFFCGFHHMNDGGYYDGWTEHEIIVSPAFDEIDLRITGRDRNQIKEYLGDLYQHALTAEVGE